MVNDDWSLEDQMEAMRHRDGNFARQAEELELEESKKEEQERVRAEQQRSDEWWAEQRQFETEVVQQTATLALSVRDEWVLADKDQEARAQLSRERGVPEAVLQWRAKNYQEKRDRELKRLGIGLNLPPSQPVLDEETLLAMYWEAERRERTGEPAEGASQIEWETWRKKRCLEQMLACSDELIPEDFEVLSRE